MQIGIVSRTDREDAIELDCSIIKYLIENGINLEIDSSLIEKLPEYKQYEVPIEEMSSDIVLCVGGDGTVLNAQHIQIGRASCRERV